MKHIIEKLEDNHGFLLDAPKFQSDKKGLEMLMQQKADKTVYGKAIRFLSVCLEQYYGQKTIVVIDEYDVPLENIFLNNFCAKKCRSVSGIKLRLVA